MKAIVVESDQSLNWKELEIPEPGAHEVRIRIHATAINRADLLQRRGLYPPPPGAISILGLECSGEIDKVGKQVSRWMLGDKVCALLAGGGYAEFCVVHEGSVLPIPKEFSFLQAASLPEVYATAWSNLYMEAGLVKSEHVVLHAGASGVGTAAIQLCRSFGNPCFVTAGDERKIEKCIELGASGGFVRHQGSFLKAAKSFSSEHGVDVILDPVGGAYLQDNLKLLSMDGRLVLIGLMGGHTTQIDLRLLLAKRLKLIGSALRTRSVESKAKIIAELEKHVWPRLVAGDICPIIESSMKITDVGAAHDLVGSNNTVGKVVLTIP